MELLMLEIVDLTGEKARIKVKQDVWTSMVETISRWVNEGSNPETVVLMPAPGTDDWIVVGVDKMVEGTDKDVLDYVSEVKKTLTEDGIEWYGVRVMSRMVGGLG